MATTDWIELTDFSPGIFQDWHGAAQAAPEGSAQLEGTYGCVGSPTGGLIPAPRLIQKYRASAAATTLGNNTYQPDKYAKQFILAQRVVSPITDNPIYTADPDYPDLIATIYGVLRDSAGTGGNGTGGVQLLPVLYKIYADPTDTTPVSYSATGAASAIGGLLPYFNGQRLPVIGYGSIDVSRTNSSGPTTPGGVVVVYSCNPITSLGSAVVNAYPSNAAPTIDGVAALSMGGYQTKVTALIAHQDRILGIVGRDTGTGLKDRVGAGYMANTEILCYTDPNDYDTSTCPSTGVAFVNESPSGYGSWVSMNASELFLIKQKGGGVIIRGDIANPQVIRMPGITSTGEAINLGTLTPLGYLYGSDNGVWLWTGADMTQNISPQLEGWFWKTPYMDSIQGAKGSWTYATPFVFGPNNFLWDTRTSSWWRFENPDDVVFSWYDTNAVGHVVAAPTYISPENDFTFAYYYNTQLGRSDYQWTSHPLMRGKQRMIELSELEVILSGSGEVTLTFEDADGRLLPPHTFQVNQVRPIHFNEKTGGKVYDPVLIIKAKAYDSNQPAPRVLAVRIAIGPGEGY